MDISGLLVALAGLFIGAAVGEVLTRAVKYAMIFTVLAGLSFEISAGGRGSAAP